MLVASKVPLQSPILDIPKEIAGFTFAGPPKCGCMWMLQALAEGGVCYRKFDSTRVHKPGRLEGVPTVAVHRHPAKWLRSYYQNMKGVRIGVAEVDEFLSLDWSSLSAFAESYLERMPGAITQMFKMYDADHVVSLENGPSDHLCELLEQLGVQHNAKAVKLTDPPNPTKNRIEWDPALYEKVAEIG